MANINKDGTGISATGDVLDDSNVTFLMLNSDKTGRDKGVTMTMEEARKRLLGATADSFSNDTLAGVVDTDHLKDGSVTPAKVDAGTSTDGQLLTSDGAGVVAWEDAATVVGGLSTVATDDTIDGDGSTSDPLALADASVTQAKLDHVADADDKQVLSYSASEDSFEWIDRPDLGEAHAAIQNIASYSTYTYSYVADDMEYVPSATWNALISEGNGDILSTPSAPGSAFNMHRYAVDDPTNTTDRNGKTYGLLAGNLIVASHTVVPTAACKGNDGIYYYSGGNTPAVLNTFLAAPDRIHSAANVGDMPYTTGTATSMTPWLDTMDLAVMVRLVGATETELWRVNPADPSDTTGVYGHKGTIPRGDIYGSATLFDSLWGFGQDSSLGADGVMIRINPEDASDQDGLFGELSPTGTAFGAVDVAGATTWDGKIYAVATVLATDPSRLHRCHT